MLKLKREQSLEVAAKLQTASLVSLSRAPTLTALPQKAPTPILFDLVGDSLLDRDTRNILTSVEQAFDSVASKQEHKSLGCRVLTLQQFPEFLIHMGIDHAVNEHDVVMVFNEISHTMIHGSMLLTLEDLQQCGMKWKIYKEFLNPDPMSEDYNAFYQSFVANKRKNGVEIAARRLILMEIEFTEPTMLLQNKLKRMTTCFDGRVMACNNCIAQVELVSSVPVDRIVQLFCCKDFTVKRHRCSELVIGFHDQSEETALLGNMECLRAVKQMQRVCQYNIPSQSAPWALFVYGGTQHARLAVLSVLQQSKIAHWEDFVELNPLDFSPELEPHEAQSVLQACQQYCFKHKQNVLKFCPEESTWEDLLQNMLEFKSAGSPYRVGVIITEDANKNRFAKRQNLSSCLVDFADEHLFALNMKGDLDLVCWTVTDDANSTPRITRVLNTLPLGGQDYWQRSLGSLLSIKNQRDDDNHMMLKRFILPTRLAIDFIITATQQQDETAALVRRTWDKSETLLLTQYSPEKVHASINTETEMVGVLEALNLPDSKCLVGKRVDQLDEVDKVLGKAFAWLISSHGSVEENEGNSLVLDGRVVEEQEIVDMCRKACEEEDGGKLRLVFLNVCGNAKSRLAQRLSTECNIPFVIYWDTKCLDRACSLLSRAFFSRLQEMLSTGQEKYLSHCVCGAFEYAKTVVETIKYEETMGYDRQFNMYKFGDMENRPVAAGVVRGRDLVYVGQVKLLSNHFEVLPSHTFQVKSDQILGILRFSPLSEVTLSGIPREEAMIPIGAKSFAYCHPPDKSLALKMRLGGGDSGEFAQLGGFTYFSADQRVLQINALCKSTPRSDSGGALKLSRQVVVAKSEWITVLQLAGRLMEMPHTPHVQLGWILPFERISPSAPQFDLGAFIQVSQGEGGRIWPVA